MKAICFSIPLELIATAVLALTGVIPAFGGVQVVTNDGDSGTGTLRAMIPAASPGDTITFSDSLTGTTIWLSSGRINLAKSVTIDGSNLSRCITIKAYNQSRVFSVGAGQQVTLRSLRLVQGNASSGGAINNFGILTVSDCAISG
jgi:hypothetical protein